MKYNKIKNIQWSMITILGLSGLAFAGGEIEAPMLDAELTTPMIENEKTNFYVGLGLEMASAREASASFSFSSEEGGQDRLGNIALIAGYELHENLVIEGRYTTTVAFKDHAEMSGWSIFAKPQYDVGRGYSVYGLLGYGNVQLDSTTSQKNVDVDENGFQWGLGINYDVNDDLLLSLDYTLLASDMDGKYLADDAADVDAITLGIHYKF